MFLLGALYEVSGTHKNGFYFAGAMLLISGLLVFFLFGVKHQHGKEERLTQDIDHEKTWLLNSTAPSSISNVAEICNSTQLSQCLSRVE